MKQLLILTAIALVIINIVLILLISKTSKVRAFILTYEKKSQAIIWLMTGIAFISLAVFVSFFIYNNTFPHNATLHGEKIEEIFLLTFILTGFVFLITQTLLFYFPYKYRHRPNRQAYFIKDNRKVELIWMIVPFVTFISLFVWGQFIWNKIHSTTNPPLEIEIVAEQFNWYIRYPGKDGKLGHFHIQHINDENPIGIDLSDKNSWDDFMPFQLHIPKNRAVKIKLRSKDVIHSMYIPNFKLKMDAVPGMVNSFTTTAFLSTNEIRKLKNDPEFNYEMACAELCGRMHFAMLQYVVVEEEWEFEKWYDSQSPWTKEHPAYTKHVSSRIP